MNAWKDTPIPGETPIDPSGLRIVGITTRAELSVVEARSIRHAFVKYLAASPSLRTAPFDIAWCQKLHREMFGEVWEWAGKIRDRNINLGLPFAAIRENLAALVADLHGWSSLGMPLVEQAARLHYRAVLIHPFDNGNGRWSRMLANIWLKRNHHPMIAWPEQMIGAESEIRAE
jgi:fido (protein-threonine AMPylation protein)